MLTREENEELTLTGPGTPMGDLIRRYWLPFLESREVPQPDSDPVRVRLMGEDLVAFRDTNGVPGLVEKYCPHRNADLFFGRNEQCGLRCTYHGWQFDVHGNCIDMPSEAPDSNFKTKVHVKSYPVREFGGVLWTYMGPPALEPETLPQMEWARIPENQRHISWNIEECNYLQAIEGGIDSVHVNFLHSTLDAHREGRQALAEIRRSPSQRDQSNLISRDTTPQFFTHVTDYGLLIGARRDTGEQTHYWRLNNFLMPFWTTPPGTSMHAFVPIDDENCMRWSFGWNVERPYTAQELWAFEHGSGIHTEMYPGTHQSTHNKRNNYQIDREHQRKYSYTGIWDFGSQDYSIQEGMGLISDRSREHLGVTDTGIIAMRRRLLDAARDLREGIEPPSARSGESYRVRGGQMVVPHEKSADWADLKEAKTAVAATW